MSFAERLKELRKEAGFSQRDLAERVEIDFTYLSKIENATVAPPREVVIRKLAYELATKLKKDEIDLAYELITSSGKFPSDLAKRVSQDPVALAYLRKLTDEVHPADDWSKAREPKSVTIIVDSSGVSTGADIVGLKVGVEDNPADPGR